MGRLSLIMLALLGPSLLCVACGQRTVQLVPTAIEGDADRDASQPPVAPDASPGADGHVSSPPSVGVAWCDKDLCVCNNGVDDDGDGRIDGEDPECTGPFDDDEASFGTGMERSNAPCQDCFFDNNNASFDDGCAYHRDCYEGDGPGPGTGGPPGLGVGEAQCGCQVSSECVNACRTRTPNGCDCFGCCHVEDREGNVRAVQLAGSCTQDTLTDPKHCSPCERDDTCVNPCGPCELCPGRDPASLPANCTGTTAPYQCDNGRVCGSTADCGDDFYCLQGCCIPVVF